MPGGSDPIPGLSSGGILPIASSSGWQRTAVPLISPTVAWEENAVYEPSIRYESGTWKMWYGGGWANGAIGYATCTGDPTVPGNWTKYASNPVLGQGGSGIGGFAVRAEVVKDGSTYYCFYSTAAGGSDIKVATSSDGISWTAVGSVLTSGSYAGTHGYANCTVWKEGSTWKMIVEASVNGSGGSPWSLYYAESSALTSGWSVLSHLSNLTISSYGEGSSSPNFAEIDGVRTTAIGDYPYQLWYHVSATDGSSIVSDMVHGGGSSVAAMVPIGTDLQANRGAYERDQAADACVLQVAGTSYLFYSGTDNSTPRSYINVATYAGLLSGIGSTIVSPNAFGFSQIVLYETSSSTAYADLATVGPEATVNVGQNGIVLVGWNAQCDVADQYISVEMSGANSLSASDQWTLSSAGAQGLGRTYVFTGLHSGETTFAAKYRVASGTHGWQRRTIWALAL